MLAIVHIVVIGLIKPGTTDLHMGLSAPCRISFITQPNAAVHGAYPGLPWAADPGYITSGACPPAHARRHLTGRLADPSARKHREGSVETCKTCTATGLPHVRRIHAATKILSRFSFFSVLQNVSDLNQSNHFDSDLKHFSMPLKRPMP